MKIIGHETHTTICDECGQEVEYTTPIFKKTPKDYWRWIKRKVLFWRGPSNTELINKVMKEHYQPAITEQIHQESLLMKYLRERG